MAQKQFIGGIHAVSALLAKASERIIRCYFQEGRDDKKIKALINQTSELTIPISYVTRHELDRLAKHVNHQGVVAHCLSATTYSENDLPKLIDQIEGSAFILVLDGIQDPHNLGACFRSSDAAKVDFIVAPKDKSCSITPVVSKVASGAVETIPFVQVTNLVRALELLKAQGIWIYGAEEEAPQTIYQTNLCDSIAIVLGGEGQGLRRLTREHCDQLVNIPMSGTVSSLNVSVAAGVILFEAVRQRKFKNPGA